MNIQKDITLVLIQIQLHFFARFNKFITSFQGIASAADQLHRRVHLNQKEIRGIDLSLNRVYMASRAGVRDAMQLVEVKHGLPQATSRDFYSQR
jgi:hypothetical protein